MINNESEQESCEHLLKHTDTYPCITISDSLIGIFSCRQERLHQEQFLISRQVRAKKHQV